MPKARLPSTPRGRKRLLSLADLLMQNARNKKGALFDYGDWGTVENPGEKPRMHCGTAACALGLAAISGRFPGLGYYIPPDAYTIRIGLNLRGYDPKKDYIGAIDVGAKYFDITEDESYHIFGGGVDVPTSQGAKAERAVARAIRQFVKGKYEPLQPDPTDYEQDDIPGLG